MNSVEVLARQNKVSRHRIRQLHTKKALSQFGSDPGLNPSSNVPCSSSSAFYIAAPNRNLRTSVQSSDHLRQDCRIVLKVSVYDANILTGGRQKALYHSWTKAAIRGPAKNPNARIRIGQFLSDSPCTIGGIVVCNEQFIVHPRQYSAHVMNEAWYVFGFIVCRRNYSYFHNLHSYGSVDGATLDFRIELLGINNYIRSRKRPLDHTV